MKLKGEPFCKIKNGTKKYELRLYDEKRKRICVDDLIEFTNQDNNEKIIVQVTEINVFDSFIDLYATLPLEQCGYAKNELSTASASDMEKYYTKEEQKLYGVVAIKIELL